jgi:hypothetical protein
MIKFEKDKLVIEIDTPDPTCAWIELQQSLCDIIRNTSGSNINDQTFFSAIDLLGELLPDWDCAKKMM